MEDTKIAVFMGYFGHFRWDFGRFNAFVIMRIGIINNNN